MSIHSIKQHDNFLVFEFDDGRKQPFKLPTAKDGDQGRPGKQGVGVKSIRQSTSDSFEIVLTNDVVKTVDLPRGDDGREIELSVQNKWVVWRYIGETEWNKLFVIPSTGLDGASDSGISKLVEQHLLNYVPYVDATGDVDLGSFNFTTTGRLTSGNATVGEINISGNTIEDGEDGININDAGTEEDGINVNGTVYNVGLRINDIGGNYPGECIIHKHSESLEAALLGSRSNSSDETHADVTNGMALFRMIAAGWVGDNYKIFGDIRFRADTSGTISNTSAPGRLEFRVTQNGNVNPTLAVYISNDLKVTTAGSLEIGGIVGLGLATSVTISGGAITISKSSYKVDTEAAAASDDLDTINGGSEGDLLVLRPVSGTRTIVVKNGTGNIFLGSDVSLDNILDTLTLMKQGSVWLRYAVGDNGV